MLTEYENFMKKIYIVPEERAERAKEYFKNGYNCCQAVLLAFSDVFETAPEQLAALGSGFGGGMGRLREVCGAVSAMTLATGFISPAVNPKEMDRRTANYALVQKLAGEFREENGSIVCKELLGLVPQQAAAAEGAREILKQVQDDSGTLRMTEGTAGQEPPRPSERTAEYYKKRPCAELVAGSARILAKELLTR